MKTTLLRSLLLFATVFTMGYTRGAEPLRMKSTDAATIQQRNLERALNRHMSFPVLEREHDMTGDVYVSFVVNTEGRLEVLSCTSANGHLRDYVLRKLSMIDIGDNVAGFWKTTHMRFSFHPEQA